MVTKARSVHELVAAVQTYEWGLVGSNSLVARLNAQNSGETIDESKPYAEVPFVEGLRGVKYYSCGLELIQTHPLKLKLLKASFPSKNTFLEVGRFSASLLLIDR